MGHRPPLCGSPDPDVRGVRRCRARRDDEARLQHDVGTRDPLGRADLSQGYENNRRWQEADRPGGRQYSAGLRRNSVLTLFSWSLVSESGLRAEFLVQAKALEHEWR